MRARLRSVGRPEIAILVLCGVLIPAEMIVKACCHATSFGDFNVHREFGRRFVEGEPLYADYTHKDRSFCYNYMPVSGLYYAPLAMVWPSVASLLRTSAAFLCLALSLHWVGEMTRDRARPRAWRALRFGAMASLLAIQYVVRDLDDGGPHLIYLAMIVGATYCVSRGREGLGAAGFGLAIALKMTPGLLLPFFAWKGRWRLTGLTAAWTAAWIVLPAAWMGPSSWWDHQRQWNRVALNIFADRTDAVHEANEVRVQNQSLKSAVVRYLVSYPEGHPLKLDHRADRAFLDLAPSTANRLALLATVGVLAAVAWSTRRPDSGPGDPSRAAEMSAVLILIVLLSPVTWLQHLVFCLPALFLLVAEHRAFRPLGRPALVVLGIYAILAIALNRGLVGRETSLLLLSLHIHTVAMLLLLGLLMTKLPTVAPAAVGPGDDSPAGGRRHPGRLTRRVSSEEIAAPPVF